MNQKTQVEEYFEGSGSQTYTFSEPVEDFVITNDGADDLTIEINGITITVKGGEAFEDSFKRFTDVVITGSTPYRAYGRN